MPAVEVRVFETPAEYEGMIDYFRGGSEEFLRGMGVDPAKVPERDAWLRAVLADHERPDREKERLYVAWYVDGELVGHSSMSHIEPDEVANVHLHLWRPDLRRAGVGTELFARSLDLYFDRYPLKRLACEPMAGNTAPNRTVQRLGFRLVGTRTCIPNPITFEQEVHRWEVTREEWAALRSGQAL